jgi:Mg-chelatase subunit ChlD
MDAARSLVVPTIPLRPGDAVGELVVTRVEPENGSTPDARTVVEVRAQPRVLKGASHLAILVDVSESMALPWDATRTRLDAARDGLLAHLRAIPASGHVSLFTFARDTRLVAGPFAPSALAKGSLDLPPPKGPARLASALDAAVAHLAAQPGPARAEILVLSDGAGDPATLRRSVARAKKLGIAVSAWVFAPDVDALFVEASHDTGGHVEKAAIPLTFGDVAP